MQVVERAVLPSNEITIILGALNALKRGDEMPVRAKTASS